MTGERWEGTPSHHDHTAGPFRSCGRGRGTLPPVPEAPDACRVPAARRAAEAPAPVLAAVEKEAAAVDGGTLANSRQVIAAQQAGGGAGDRPQEGVELARVRPLPIEPVPGGGEAPASKRQMHLVVEDGQIVDRRGNAADAGKRDPPDRRPKRVRPFPDRGRLTRLLLGQPQEWFRTILRDEPGVGEPGKQVRVSRSERVALGCGVEMTDGVHEVETGYSPNQRPKLVARCGGMLMRAAVECIVRGHQALRHVTGETEMTDYHAGPRDAVSVGRAITFANEGERLAPGW